MAADIVSAYVTKNSLSPEQVTDLIQTVFVALSSLGGPVPAEIAQEAQRPAVSPRRSVAPDYIVCLEDGKKLKMLKRHLRTTYDMTPEQYRAKWGLPLDYPMVAPNYAQQRSDFAKKIGLGHSRSGTASAPRQRKTGK
ncbi:MAG: MucR family transcriptional regulator [Alphaproteobacteria bacterium]